MGVCLSTEIERVHIGDRGRRQNSFILCAELICAHGQNREKALFLPQGQPIDGNLGTSEFHCNVALQFFELFHTLGFQFDEHRHMEQRFFVLAEVGKQLNNILQIALGFNAFAYIIAAAFQPIAASGILDNFTLFHRFNKPMVNAKRHTVAVGELREDRLLLGGRGIFTNSPHTAVTVTDDIMVG